MRSSSNRPWEHNHRHSTKQYMNRLRSRSLRLMVSHHPPLSPVLARLLCRHRTMRRRRRPRCALNLRNQLRWMPLSLTACSTTVRMIQPQELFSGMTDVGTHVRENATRNSLWRSATARYSWIVARSMSGNAQSLCQFAMVPHEGSDDHHLRLRARFAALAKPALRARARRCFAVIRFADASPPARPARRLIALRRLVMASGEAFRDLGVRRLGPRAAQSQSQISIVLQRPAS